MRRVVRLNLLLILVSISLIMAACAMPGRMASSDQMKSAPAATPEPGKLTVIDGRARPAAQGDNGAAYLTVLNGLDKAVQLTSASGDVAQVIELHETVNDNGVMRMQPRPEGFAVPAGDLLELMPGGKHVMLIGVAKSLAPGDSFALTLHFDSGDAIAVNVPVLDMTMDMPANMAAESAHDMHDMHAMTGTMAGMEHGAPASELTALDPPVALEPDAAAVFAKLPIASLHDMDESLAAGKLDPSFAATVAELQTLLGSVSWPALLQPQVDAAAAGAETLHHALGVGDVAAAAAAASQVHEMLHTMQHSVAAP